MPASTTNVAVGPHNTSCGRLRAIQGHNVPGKGAGGCMFVGGRLLFIPRQLGTLSRAPGNTQLNQIKCYQAYYRVLAIGRGQEWDQGQVLLESHSKPEMSQLEGNKRCISLEL